MNVVARPLWVAQQFETACFEGLQARWKQRRLRAEQEEQQEQEEQTQDARCSSKAPMSRLEDLINFVTEPYRRRVWAGFQSASRRGHGDVPVPVLSGILYRRRPSSTTNRRRRATLRGQFSSTN